MTTSNKTKEIQKYTYPVLNMGLRLREMQKILTDFQEKDIVNRIWHKDHTVWKPSPAEISDRLGWLNVIDTMVDKIPELESFAREVKKEFHHVVLLGMGGSSLGPEVLRQTFGSGPDYPPLIVLDSTHSAAVEEVVKTIEPRHTLFLVSSKSGTTTETMSFYRYFRNLVSQEMGEEKSGRNFAAITDYGTPLARLAQETGFRRTFINPSDIGGRYSVLSYFGLVPAVLTGIDIKSLIQNASKMQENCAPCVDIYENPGVWLGALTGSLALHGHDKLTFIISPSIRSFGLWVEQLLAESLGKEGRGVIPVIDEPPVDPKYYGDDRLFVYLRMKGDNNRATDQAVERLEVAGQPVIQLEMAEQLDMGSEFFRWEFATATAGMILGVNPFDQPDVQATKEATKEVIKEYESAKRMPRIEACGSLNKWLEQARRDNYLAITAYIKQTPSVDRAFAFFRKRIIEKYHIATTLGYGPRYLHSTGQLHKGGTNTGLYIQVTAARRKDLQVPDEPHSFNVLTEAEALGDYHALESKNRKIIRLQLCAASGAAIERIAEEV